jgi:hypothetical protein
MTAHRAVLGVVVALGLLPGAPARADWPVLGRALCIAAKDQVSPRAATDGANGAIVVWQDTRSSRVNVFARRVLASGEPDPAWPVDGLAALADSTTLLATAFAGQQFPVVVPDGAGGAIIAWQDGRSEASGLDIFAQHVLGSGVVDPAWPANGRALCTATGDQDVPAIVADGTGGAIVTWMDGRNAGTIVDIFAQHVLASGAIDPLWPADGVALCDAPAPQSFPRIASDGAGGAIVTWNDFRPSATSIDIYVQHVLSTGVVDPAWPANGLGLCLAPGPQVNATIVSDDAHGAIVSWEDPRDGVNRIYAQRVLGSGVIAAGWPVNGRAVSDGSFDQLEPILAADGANGAILTWRDLRNGTNHNPFAQHVLASGVVDPAWPVEGRALSTSSGEEVAASIVADGGGGAIIAWEEDSFVFAHHVLSSGGLDPAFPVNGRFVRLLLDFEHDPDLVRSGGHDAIVAWSDAGSSQDFDIYAQLVPTQTTVGVGDGMTASRVSFATPNPNPARAAVTLSFALPRETTLRLAIYDVGGREVRELISGVQSAGTHQVRWDLRDDRGEPVPPGVCFARLEVGGRAITRKVVTAP